MSDSRTYAFYSRRLQLQTLEPRQMLSLSAAVIPSLEATPIDIPFSNEIPSIRSPYRPPAKSEIASPTPLSGLQQALEDALLGSYEENEPPTIPPTIEALNSQVQLAIAGDGFFLVQSGTGRLLTRSGNLKFNEYYELVTSQGDRVLGYRVNDDFDLQTNNLVPLSLPIEQEVAQPTTEVTFQGVLNPSSDPSHVASDEFEIFDPEGNSIDFAIDVTLLSKTSTSTTFQWIIRFESGASETSETSGSLEFDANGDVRRGGFDTLLITTDSSTLEIVLNFDAIKSLGEIDAQGNPISTINAAQSGGFAPGRLFDVIVTEDGKIQGQFDTGLQLLLGQVVLATVANPHGLQQVGPGIYDTTAESGFLIFGEPSSLVFGSIVSLPAGFYLRHDGLILEQDDNGPRTIDAPQPNPLNLRYPWLLRFVDLTLFGNEFFVVDGPDGQFRYTRDGRFHLNSQHQLVTQDGLRVLGYALGEDGTLVEQLAPLTIPFQQITSKATEHVTLAGNLDPTFDAATPDGAESLTSASQPIQLGGNLGTETEFIVYDRWGIQHHLSLIVYLESLDEHFVSFRWSATSTDPTAVPGSDRIVGTGALTFKPTGEIVAGETGLISLQTFDGGVHELRLDLSQVELLDQRDPRDNPISVLNLISQDGYPPGVLKTYSVGETGEIVGEFSSGLTMTLGQIKLATFANPHALNPIEGNLFEPTDESGPAEFVTPGEQGSSTINERSASSHQERPTRRNRYREAPPERLWDEFGLEAPSGVEEVAKATIRVRSR